MWVHSHSLTELQLESPKLVMKMLALSRCTFLRNGKGLAQ